LSIKGLGFFVRNVYCWDSIYICTSASDSRNDYRNPTPLIFSELRQNFQTFSYSDYRDCLSYIYITQDSVRVTDRIRLGTIPPLPITQCAKSHLRADSCRPHKQRASDYVLGIFKLFSKYLTIGNGITAKPDNVLSNRIDCRHISNTTSAVTECIGAMCGVSSEW